MTFKIGDNIIRIDISDCSEPIEATPSQWIEGQIPQNKPGLYAIWTVNNQPHIVKAFADGGGSMLTYQCWQNYTHYIPILNLLSSILPPPPPVKEVEAYGFLQRFNEIQDMILKEIEDYERLEDKARHFYSQPATAEVKEKYLKWIGGNVPGWVDQPELTLDKYINQCEDGVLFFKPTALKELGVK